MGQLARIPARKEQARNTIRIIFGTAMLTTLAILWFTMNGHGIRPRGLGAVRRRSRMKIMPSGPASPPSRIRDRHDPDMAHRSGADERGGLANAQPGPHGRASDRAAPARPASRSGRTGYRAR